MSSCLSLLMVLLSLSMIASTAPEAFRGPPNTPAASTITMVPSMLLSPPLITRVSTISTPVGSAYPLAMALMTSINEAPWNTHASTIATRIPEKKVGTVGFLRTMRAMTTTGGISIIGLILNVLSRVDNIISYSALSMVEPVWFSPSIA